MADFTASEAQADELRVWFNNVTGENCQDSDSFTVTIPNESGVGRDVLIPPKG